MGGCPSSSPPRSAPSVWSSTVHKSPSSRPCRPSPRAGSGFDFYTIWSVSGRDRFGRTCAVVEKSRPDPTVASLTRPPEPRITSLAMVSPPLPTGGDMKADEPAAAFTIRRYEERLARDPGSLAFAPLADAHRKAGRPGEAIRLCREGLERFPDYATARLILAKALVDGGDPEAALAEVRVILQGNSADAQAHR